jgi:hypothetical protein
MVLVPAIVTVPPIDGAEGRDKAENVRDQRMSRSRIVPFSERTYKVNVNDALPDSDPPISLKLPSDNLKVPLVHSISLHHIL